MGIRIRHRLPRPGLGSIVFAWKDDTFQEPLYPDSELNRNIVVNGNCTDISKEKVEAVHEMVFGYSLGIDPRTFEGKIVVKSNLNGEHDGIEVSGPLNEIKHGVVYQRVVNNFPPKDYKGITDEDRKSTVCDLRIPILMGKPCFIYLKTRPKRSRFSNTNSLVTIVDLEDFLSVDEIQMIFKFCKAFELDYGEIDVVRDADDGRIYVLDINKTPLGPPNGLSDKDNAVALGLYEAVFQKTFNEFACATNR